MNLPRSQWKRSRDVRPRCKSDAENINLVDGEMIFGIEMKKLGIQSFIAKILEPFTLW